VDDLLPPGTLHAAFVRSSCAHARIAGNLCRCTGYRNIIAAIKESAANFTG
jgi:aerobic-type carbon monoxide dehydrogenase small subunit (CoxS/CutS family)